METSPRWLSFQPLRLNGSGTYGDQWQVAQLPDDLARRAQWLATRRAAGQYDSQKELLDKVHVKEGRDVFVASYQIASKDQGPKQSLTVWTEGVDSMLPVTELVAVNQLANGKSQLLVVPWEQVVAEAGALMDDTGLVPPRFRVAQFPDVEAMDRLRRHAVIP
jgi:hypothetical protein